MASETQRKLPGKPNQRGCSFCNEKLDMENGIFLWIGDVSVNPRTGLTVGGVAYANKGNPKTQTEAEACLYYDLLELVLPVLERQKKRCARTMREARRKYDH